MCTGVIVGKKLTKDGSTIFGRTEDLKTNHNKIYVVHPKAEYKKKQKIKDISYSKEKGYEFVFEHDSYGYTSISDTTLESGLFDEAGFNDMGLIADMTVSAKANDEVLKVDPYLDGSDENKNVGISEAILPTIVLGSAKNAKEAIFLIAKEISINGAAEGNGLVVADQSEVWYMEIYTGHQFVAFKYPEDSFSVFPNTFWLNEVILENGEDKKYFLVDKKEEYIYSKEIFEVAKKANSFVGNEQNFMINLQASYGPKKLSDSNRSRVCSGILHLNKNAKVSMKSKKYSFLQKTNEKIDVEKVMSFTTNRLENIGIEANDFGETKAYPIGNRNTMEAHIFQLPNGNSLKFPGVMWLSLGSPRTSPFIAYYPNQNKAIKQAQNNTNKYSCNSVYWLAMDNFYMVELNEKEFMPIVDKYLKPLQKDLVEKTSLKPISTKEANKRNSKDAKLGFEIMKKINRELKKKYLKYLAENDYVSIYFGSDKTAIFSQSQIKVFKNTYNRHLNLKVDVEDMILKVVDDYGNLVEDLNKEIIFKISKKAFEEDFKIFADEIELEVKNIGNFYEFKTKSTKIKMFLEKK